ncbi:MAG: GAF domain-containing protein, partial [Anaerolineae bacterium]
MAEIGNPRPEARLATLSRIALLAAEGSDLQRLAGELVKEARKTMSIQHCTLALLDEAGQRYRRLPLAGESGGPEADLPAGEGLAGEVMRSGEPRLVEASGGASATVLCLPLRAGGQVWGALTLGADIPHAYDEADVAWAGSLATHLALAAERDRLRDGIRRLGAEVGRLGDEVARLGSFPELNPAAIIELDLSGEVHYLNPAARALFPNCRREGLGSPLFVELEGV